MSLIFVNAGQLFVGAPAPFPAGDGYLAGVGGVAQLGAAPETP